MSKLEQLIKKYCPNGVEYTAISDAVETLKTGLNPRKNFVLNEEGADCFYVTGKDVFNHSVNISNRTDRITKDTVALINKRACLHDDILLFASTGTGTVGRMAVIEKYTGNWNVSETMYIITVKEGLILTKYLFHVLNSNVAIEQYEPKISRSSVPHLKVVDLLSVRIPIPPLPVQEEIVRILDSYTEIESELEVELADELEMRKKQYEYYRDKMLSLEDYDGKVKEKLIGNIATVGTGTKPSKILDEPTDFDYINAGTSRSGYFSESNRKGDVTTTPSRGQGGIGFVGYQSKSFWLGPLCYAIRSNNTEEILNKYIYYWLSAHNYLILQCMNEGGTPAVNKKDIESINICYPDIDEQKRIVTMLDRFQILTEDIADDLPAEIQMRHQQFEYYRDKLLTFKRLEAV